MNADVDDRMEVLVTDVVVKSGFSHGGVLSMAICMIGKVTGITLNDVVVSAVVVVVVEPVVVSVNHGGGSKLGLFL